MEEFLHQYGYIALAIGTFFEGETAILVASSLVSSGFFKWPYTVLFGFFGSFVSDWLYFTIGRLNGKYFVDKRPNLKAKLAPTQKFFKTHRLQILFSYRFLYGFRVILPLMIGMSDIKVIQFLGYSILAGLMWATTVSSVGYIAGVAFELTPRSFEENVLFIVLGFSMFGLLVGYSVKRYAESKMKVPHTDLP
ncbi:MAG: DedA family protein [Cyclobacteriaceae bacterium]|nr:DedA family protein [Cyclobacteriaceae bacterium]